MSQPEKQSTAPGRVDELDGLRGLLALWVVLAHMFAWSGYWECRLPHRLEGAWTNFVEAAAAVDTFIILSGFAISFLLHKRSQSYGSFMTGRFFRIYPVYLFCLILGIATTFLTPFILQTAGWNNTIYFDWVRSLTHSSSTALGAHTFWHLTLLNGLLPNRILENAAGTLLVPAWSITLEWQYYLIAPLLARFVRSGTGILFITAGQWLIVSAVTWVGVKYGLQWRNPQLAFLPAHLPLFLVGIGSYHFYARFHREETDSPIPATAVALLLAVAFLLKCHVIALTAWALGFGCILVRGNDPLGRVLSIIRKFLLHPALQWLGHISFPLYLIHWPIIIAIMFVHLHGFPQTGSARNLVVLLALGLPLILLAAHLIHIHLELPMMAMGKKVGRRKSRDIPPVAEGAAE